MSTVEEHSSEQIELRTSKPRAVLKADFSIAGRWDSDRLVFKVSKLNKYKSFVARRALEPLSYVSTLVSKLKVVGTATA